MKKHFILVLIVVTLVSIVLAGCNTNSNSNIQVEDTNASQNNILSADDSKDEGNIATINMDWPYYKSLDELISSCSYVIIGRVDSILPTIRIHENKELDYAWANYRPAHILVEQVIVGDIEENTYIDIVQPGGTYTGISENGKDETITEVVEDMEYLEIGTRYLMFVKEADNPNEDIEYSYFLASPMVGYSKIEDGALKIHEDNNLFENDLNIDQAILEIQNTTDK